MEALGSLLVPFDWIMSGQGGGTGAMATKMDADLSHHKKGSSKSLAEKAKRDALHLVLEYKLC